jgi:hypothetical protein
VYYGQRYYQNPGGMQFRLVASLVPATRRMDIGQIESNMYRLYNGSQNSHVLNQSEDAPDYCMCWEPDTMQLIFAIGRYGGIVVATVYQTGPDWLWYNFDTDHYERLDDGQSKDALNSIGNDHVKLTATNPRNGVWTDKDFLYRFDRVA